VLLVRKPKSPGTNPKPPEIMPQNPPFAPSDDLGLREWGDNFSTKLTATPLLYGETAPVAVAVAALQLAFSNALDTSSAPATRTSVTIAAKNLARAEFTAGVFPVAVRIGANRSVLPENKVAIGVTVPITTRTRNPLGGVALQLTLESQDATGTNLRSQNPATPDTTARPEGARAWEIEQKIYAADGLTVESTNTTFGTRRFARVLTPVGKAGRRADFRARWIGAPLNGGAVNNGDWSDTVQVTMA